MYFVVILVYTALKVKLKTTSYARPLAKHKIEICKTNEP